MGVLRQGVVALAVLVAGCYSGADAGDDDGDTESGSATEGSTGESGDDGDGTGGTPAECEGIDIFDPGPSPLRRLTQTQYNNTLRDLFPNADIPEQTILADPKSHGFENFAEQQTPSALLIEQYQRAAVEATDFGWPDVESRLGCDETGGADAAGCGHEFLRDFGERAFRRPLSPSEESTYLAFFDARLAEHNFRVALELTMQAFLQSPSFIYFFEFEGTPDGQLVRLDGYALASRLSYFLWDTMPDEDLLAAAQSGELDAPEGVEAEALRMLAEIPARGAVVNFHRQWLDFEKTETIAPDLETYPNWRDEMRDSMREGLERTVEHVVFDADGTVQELLAGNQAFVDDTLAELYGVPAPGGWALTELDESERSGILTNAGFLAGTSHAVHPSPVQRGVFVLERILCAPPPAPPPEVDTNPPEGDEQNPTTNRERYDVHSEDAVCFGCHRSIDGIGFGFENYDSLGQWRDLDAGQTVDASGEIVVGSEIDGPFDNALQMVDRLSQSDVVRDCVVTQYLRYSLGRNIEDDDLCTEATLRNAFENAGGGVQELLIAIVKSDAFRYRRGGSN